MNVNTFDGVKWTTIEMAVLFFSFFLLYSNTSGVCVCVLSMNTRCGMIIIFPFISLWFRDGEFSFFFLNNGLLCCSISSRAITSAALIVSCALGLAHQERTLIIFESIGFEFDRRLTKTSLSKFSSMSLKLLWIEKKLYEEDNNMIITCIHILNGQHEIDNFHFQITDTAEQYQFSSTGALLNADQQQRNCFLTRDLDGIQKYDWSGHLFAWWCPGAVQQHYGANFCLIVNYLVMYHFVNGKKLS